MSEGPETTRLIVFSDDWGRHPSSSQHIVSRLLPRYPTLWVNTIGTRLPGLSFEDLFKVGRKLATWIGRPKKHALPANLRIINPRMWPGFRARWQRKLNAALLSKAVNSALGPRQPNERRVVITTIPITADLIGRLQVDRWIYYCVDDFSTWPGLDAGVMRDMERDQVQKVDAIITVSDTLKQRLSGMGRESTLITHGIDLAHWTPRQTPESAQSQPWRSPPINTHIAGWWGKLPRPILLFWGLVDARLDAAWCRALTGVGTLVLVGPLQSPPEGLEGSDRIVLAGPVPYEDLPALAEAADVLVMPYADAPVTRAMQPLKFKEYLATGKPVVVRKLPATEPWADAADVVATPTELVERVRARVNEGVPMSQVEARKRLVNETWDHKAAEFERVIQENLPRRHGGTEKRSEI